MDESLLNLTLSALAFVVSHIMLSHGRVRSGLIARLGLWPHRAVYSVIGIVTFLWLVSAYKQAPTDQIFAPVIALQHMPLTLMLLASILLVGGYTIANPSALVLEDMNSGEDIPGILKITRAPVMWGTGLFAFSHMLANTHLASWIFFGSLTFLAIVGGWHLDRRKHAEGDASWLEMEAQTSFIPFAAMLSRRTKLKIRELGWWRLALALGLYAVMLAAHRAVVGASPMPLPD